MWFDLSTLRNLAGKYFVLKKKDSERVEQIKQGEESKATLIESDQNDGFVDIVAGSETCCICWANTIQEVLECNHSFCSNCLVGW